jgi:hypothetical protein
VRLRADTVRLAAALPELLRQRLGVLHGCAEGNRRPLVSVLQDRCRRGDDVLLLRQHFAELRPNELSVLHVDAVQVDVAEQRVSGPRLRKVSVLDAPSQIMLDGDRLEHMPHRHAVAAVWRGCEPEHLRVSEVLQDIAIGTGRGPVRLVHDDVRERVPRP